MKPAALAESLHTKELFPPDGIGKQVLVLQALAVTKPLRKC